MPDSAFILYFWIRCIDTMRRNRGALNYATGTATSKNGLINMYIHGGAIISVFTLFIGLVSSGSVDAAIQVWWEFYMTKVLPWPIDELLTASGLTDFILSHAITIGVGLISATSKWWARA
jgi:hypothetical protein